MTRSNVPLIALALLGATACSNVDAQPSNEAKADPRYRTSFPPNTGTAPDYLANCIQRAVDAYGVTQDGVRLDDPVQAADGIRTVTGTADRGAAGRTRFRCRFAANDAFLDFVELPPAN